jgi:DNA-binding transcriptional LysR family regulator
MKTKLSKISLHQLEVFRSIVLAGSISKAASLVNLSQPTLSQTLASLEKTLNVLLVIRSRKSEIEMTPAGKFWYSRAIETLNLIHSAEIVHENLFVNKAININFGTTPSLQGNFDGLVAKAIKEISQLQSLTITSFLGSKQICNALLSHKINIGVAAYDELKGHQSSLKIINLYYDKRLWAVPRSVPIEDVLASINKKECVGDHECLTRYVGLQNAQTWNRRTVDWYQEKLPLSFQFYGVSTHLSAVQIASTGIATCHVPVTLIGNLPSRVKESLVFYDTGETGREVCLAFPKHMQSIKPFMDFSIEVQKILRHEISTSGEIVYAPLKFNK